MSCLRINSSILLPVQVSLAHKITAHLPLAHGAPVHHGSPNRIGISDIAAPDFGDSVRVRKIGEVDGTGAPLLEDDVPVFWACGVTAIMAAASALAIPVCITHSPGCMFVCDVPQEKLYSHYCAVDFTLSRMAERGDQRVRRMVEGGIAMCVARDPGNRYLS